MLGNFRAALITALVIPVAMLMTAAGMLQGRISANLMSLGALDFRPDRRWRGDHYRKRACAIWPNARRRRAARFRFPSACKRCRQLAEEMIGPSVYGQAIIILVYVPLLTFSGVEGKMFEPMALTVILALARGVRAVADLRAGADCHFRHRPGHRRRQLRLSGG